MGKKLTDEKIIDICRAYVLTNLTMKELSKMYDCSASHISKTIHKAIVLRYS